MGLKMTIKDIAKKALAHFKDKGYVFTPSEYEEVFCKIARRYGVIIEDCNKIAKYLSKLDSKYKAIAKSYNIKNFTIHIFNSFFYNFYIF